LKRKLEKKGFVALVADGSFHFSRKAHSEKGAAGSKQKRGRQPDVDYKGGSEEENSLI